MLPESAEAVDDDAVPAAEPALAAELAVPVPPQAEKDAVINDAARIAANSFFMLYTPQLFSLFFYL